MFLNGLTRWLRARLFDQPKPGPRFGASPGIQEDIDSRQNVETKPPDDEGIDLYCFWAVEFYTPEHLNALFNGFRELGWEAVESGDRKNSDPVEWISGLRRRHLGSGWMNLGFFIPPESNLFMGGPTHKVPLPEGVKYASGGIHSVSQSLIGVVICFVFEEEYSVSFDKALRADRQTFETSRGRISSIHFPITQKSDHVAQIRIEMSTSAASWFRDHLPGVFTLGLLDGELPTCEFVTLQKAEPFPPRPEDGQPEPLYLSILGLNHDADIWTSVGTPGLKIKLVSGANRSPRFHSTITMKDALPLGRPSDLWNNSRSSRITRLNLMVPAALTTSAILPLLRGYEQQIRKVRESSIVITMPRQSSTKALESVGSYLSNCVDISAVASELAENSREGLLAGFPIEPFQSSPRRNSDEPLILGKVLHSTIRDTAFQLQSSVRSMSEQLTQFGSLLGALEDIRTQKEISNLTKVLVVLTVVIVLTSLPAFLTSAVRFVWEHLVQGIGKLWTF